MPLEDGNVMRGKFCSVETKTHNGLSGLPGSASLCNVGEYIATSTHLHSGRHQVHISLGASHVRTWCERGLACRKLGSLETAAAHSDKIFPQVPPSVESKSDSCGNEDQAVLVCSLDYGGGMLENCGRQADSPDSLLVLIGDTFQLPSSVVAPRTCVVTEVAT